MLTVLTSQKYLNPMEVFFFNLELFLLDHIPNSTSVAQVKEVLKTKKLLKRKLLGHHY